MTTLKPCPFCGGESVLQSQEYGGSAKVVNTITCVECGVTKGDLYGPTEKAIEAWNRRSDPWRTRAEEALQEAKRSFERILNEHQFSPPELDRYIDHLNGMRDRIMAEARAALAKIEALRSKSEAVQ